MSAFEGCSQVEQLYVPGSLKEISGMAFSGCAGLKSVYLAEGVTKIGSCAFAKCGAMDIWIPDTVSSISSVAFEGTTAVIHCRKDSKAHIFAKSEKLKYVLDY